MKKIYEYSPETGEFVGESDATPNPRKPGEYLPRINATFEPPPDIGERQVTVWQDDAWAVATDRRGEKYWHRDTNGRIAEVEIKAIGETVPVGAYRTRDEVPLTATEKAQNARSQRDGLLAQADILILKAEDTGGDTSALRTYRQTLRDVPEQAGFPDAISWPVLPGA
ncbi:MAG: phage tail assembly chaperone [Burkholderiaceae bacterium]|nr:phage tail assembly chaperone [Burkholderiaceae bacterium]